MVLRRHNTQQASPQAAASSGWPGVNQLVVVGDRDGNEHRSRVEDRDDCYVVVAALSNASAAWHPADGDQLIVSWPTPRGLMQLPAVFVQTDLDAVRVWRLRPNGDAELLQRRDAPRANAALVASVVTSCGARLTGTVVDVSEGGVRLSVRHAHQCLEVDNEIQFAFRLGDRQIHATALIRRVTKNVDNFDELGASATFTADERQAIRAYVWDSQRRMLVGRNAAADE